MKNFITQNGYLFSTTTDEVDKGAVELTELEMALAVIINTWGITAFEAALEVVKEKALPLFETLK